MYFFLFLLLTFFSFLDAMERISSSAVSQAPSLKPALSIPSYLGFLPRELLTELEKYRTDRIGNFLLSKIPLPSDEENLPKFLKVLRKQFPEHFENESSLGSLIIRLARIQSLQGKAFYSPNAYPLNIITIVKAISNPRGLDIALAEKWYGNYLQTQKQFRDKVQHIDYKPTILELQELYSSGVLNPSMLIISTIDPFTGVPLKVAQEYSLLEILLGRKAFEALNFLLEQGAAVSSREIERARLMAKADSEMLPIVSRLLEIKNKQ